MTPCASLQKKTFIKFFIYIYIYTLLIGLIRVSLPPCMSGESLRLFPINKTGPCMFQVPQPLIIPMTVISERCNTAGESRLVGTDPEATQPHRPVQGAAPDCWSLSSRDAD